VKLQFDANQKFQLDAVAAVVDLFDGQPRGAPEYAVIKTEGAGIGALFAGQEQTELGVGNRLVLDDQRLRANTRAVQARNEIEAEDRPTLDAWELFDIPANTARDCPHFSVEMETGTGKTYVYLRTIFELSRRYGFQKFVIVVPSVAIREGVLKNIEVTREHFRALYNNLPFEHFVYGAKSVNLLRQFALSTTLEILVINIDAFRKNFSGTEAEQKSNVIYKESDRLSGRQPIEFVQAARPIVIIDEPQSVDSTEKAQDAVKALNPLCTLRYSATHKSPHNLVYRLDPVRAFELRLVKQIVVGSAIARGTGGNDAFVKVEQIDYKNGIKAKLRINVQGPKGPKLASVPVKNGADLFALSKERAEYRQGFEIVEIDATPEHEFLKFSNGRVLRLGEEIGGLQGDVWRLQIRHTVQRHLEKELEVRGRGIKVLTLFFIDRVANYRDYAEGKPVAGKFAVEIAAALADLRKEGRFKAIEWLALPADRLHNGYFAQDRKGTLKDTRGDTQADDEVYDLIMKDKERLLSIDEPLRFIFSHSALREGWDNPNVFQICNLREMTSERERRQTLGRGLRLPVDQNGMRVMDDSINRLYVMANETYEDFAKALQKEYEDDCGVTFGKLPVAAFARLMRIVGGAEVAIGATEATAIREALVAQKMLDSEGRLQPAFDPKRKDFAVNLPAGSTDMSAAVIDLLSSYQMERHIRRERDERTNGLNKQVLLSPEFAALWDRIKPRTTYRVEFDTDKLVARSADAIRAMSRMDAPSVHVTAAQVSVQRAGVAAVATRASEEKIVYAGPLPDILAYLQNETELTRSTIVRILKASERLKDFFVNPQRFMDQVAAILKNELHRLLIDGIKYERIAPDDGPGASWEMTRFESAELVNYLTSLQVKKSIYDYVPYDSEVEREFARRLDEREEIKLFVKLPRWFTIDTPVGTYNPDWAILKHDGQALYLARETKSTKDFLKLRTPEADKVRCGKSHFDAIGVPFEVVVSADDV
jgi:type III restriction enzyme